jgi:uncharacterized protein YbjT (DUF2867 family)
MYLVVGASGTVGRRVARRLLERGDPVRAVSRHPSRLTDLASLGAEAVPGDLRDGGWMDDALRGVRALVLSTHGLVPPSRDNHPGITDEAGNRRIIDAAKRAGVEHVVFVSATSGAGSPVLFGQVKYRVEEYLRGSGLDYTILRPTVFGETHAVLLLAQPLRERGKVQIFGPGTTRVNWISADDVADYVVRALDDPSLRNAVRVIGGPDRMSRLEALALVERIVGRPAKRAHVPLPAMRLVRGLVGPFHPGMRFLLDMAIAETDAPEDACWAPSELDWTGPTPLEEVVRRWAAEPADAQAVDA